MDEDRIKCAYCHRFIEHTTILGWVHINCWTDHEPEPRAVEQPVPVDAR
jgi:hypothetical protein